MPDRMKTRITELGLDEFLKFMCDGIREQRTYYATMNPIKKEVGLSDFSVIEDIAAAWSNFHHSNNN